MIYLFLTIEALLVLSNNVVSFYFSIAVFEETNSSSMMAISVFLSLAPTIYLSFVAGNVVDQVGKNQIVIICSYLFLVVYLLLATLTSYAYLTSGAIFLFIFIRSVISSFHDIAIMTWIPEQVEEKDLRLAYGFQGFINKGALLTGPIVAGLIYTRLDVSIILYVSTLLAGVSLIIACLMADQSIRKPSTKLKIDMGSCLSYLNTKPKLRASLYFFCAFNTVNGIASAFLVAYVLMIFGEYEVTLSVYNFFVAIGALCGTLYSIKRLSFEPLILIGVTTLLCALLGRFAISFTSSLLVFSILIAVRSALIPVGNMANQILWVEQTESTSRGSLFGFRRLVAQGIYPISIFICALFIEFFGLASSVEFLSWLFVFSGLFEMIIAFFLIKYAIKQ